MGGPNCPSQPECWNEPAGSGWREKGWQPLASEQPEMLEDSCVMSVPLNQCRNAINQGWQVMLPAVGRRFSIMSRRFQQYLLQEQERVAKAAAWTEAGCFAGPGSSGRILTAGVLPSSRRPCSGIHSGCPWLSPVWKTRLPLASKPFPPCIHGSNC